MLIWTTRTVEIESDGEYLATVEGDVAGSAGARITRCASCWDSLDAQVNVGQSRPLTLTAGRYFITFIKEVKEPLSFRIVVAS